MLREDTTIDKIEVLPNGVLQIRQKNAILKDEVEIASSFHRWTLVPGDALDGQDDRVVAVANAIWTPDIIDAYQSHIREHQETAVAEEGAADPEPSEAPTEDPAPAEDHPS
mgnify:CR=1 FL=1